MNYRSFVRMDMAGKHDIYFISDQPSFKHHPHGLSFHEVVFITIVPWRMHENNQPWRF